MRTDRNERIALYQEAQAIFHRDVPWVPLAHAQRILVINRSCPEPQTFTSRVKISPQRIT